MRAENARAFTPGNFVQEVVARQKRSKRALTIAVVGAGALLAVPIILGWRTPAWLLVAAAVVTLAFDRWKRHRHIPLSIPTSGQTQPASLTIDAVQDVQLIEHGETWGARLHTNNGIVELHGSAAASLLLQLMSALDGCGTGTEAEAGAALQRVEQAGGANAYLRQFAARTSRDAVNAAEGASLMERLIREPSELLPFEAALRQAAQR